MLGLGVGSGLLLGACGGSGEGGGGDLDAGDDARSSADSTASDGRIGDAQADADEGDGAPATDAPKADAAPADADATSGCPTGPFGAGDYWPPACWRPFASSSPFNTKLPASPKLLANSSAIVHRVLGDTTPIVPGATQPANLLALEDHHGGWPTYYGRAADPTFKVHCNEFGGACTIGDGVITLHAPSGATLQGGCGADPASDRHLTVVDQTSGWEYDLWHVSTCPLPAAGGTIEIGWGGHARMDGDGIDVDVGQGMASSTADLAGRVRVEEFATHRIDHALNIVIDCGTDAFVYPARAFDKKCADLVDAPPMGARFQLAMTAAEIDALPAPVWKKTLLHAMAEYGMFFGDTGSSFFFDIQIEGGDMYTTMGAAADPWLTFAKAEGWGYYGVDPYKGYTGSMHNGDDGMDWKAQVWSKLRVVDPCVSKGTCP